MSKPFIGPSVGDQTFCVGSTWRGPSVKELFQSEFFDVFTVNHAIETGEQRSYIVSRSDSKYLTIICKSAEGKIMKDPSRCCFKVHCLVRASDKLVVKDCILKHSRECKNLLIPPSPPVVAAVEGSIPPVVANPAATTAVTTTNPPPPSSIRHTIIYIIASMKVLFFLSTVLQFTS